MSSIIKTAAKFAVSLAILSYLVSDIRHNAPDTFANVISQPKNWWCVAGGLLSYACALLIGLVRWQLLARALQLPLRFAQTLRIGALAYVIEIIGIGIGGGDAARATMLARMNPRFAAPAIISVAVDRAIGGFVILWYLSLSRWLVDIRDAPIVAGVHTIQTLAVLSIAGLAAWALLPQFSAWAAAQARRLGRIGAFAARMIEAAESYRGRGFVLVTAFAITSITLLLITTSFYLLAVGLPGGAPTWREHTVIIPLLLMTALVPLPVQGLGVADYALNYLYQHVASVPPHFGQGLVIAMAFRLVGITLCAVAAAIYALSPLEPRD